MSHSLDDAIRQLSRKLAPRARHTMFLLGAGASCAAGFPDLAGLQALVAAQLDGNDKVVYDKLAATPLNLEGILSRLRLLAAALAGISDVVAGLTSESALKLDATICGAIKRILTTTPSTVDAHRHFALWAASGVSDRPLEIFTTNYDLLIERGLESIGVPYFDGFVGAYAARFRSDLVDEDVAEAHLMPPRGWPRLWKLHGSISWTVGDKATDVVRFAGADHESLVIYPSLQKYEESRRVPFVAIADRFRRSLALPETLLITTGYAFGDQHINELIFNAAATHPRSEIVSLFYDTAPPDVIRRATELPNFTIMTATDAVIGGDRAEWDLANANAMLVSDAKARVGDFGVLAKYLALRAGRESTTGVAT